MLNSGLISCSGPAAEKQAEEKLIEQLAAEVEANSSIALRSVWKWTCYQVRHDVSALCFAIHKEQFLQGIMQKLSRQPSCSCSSGHLADHSIHCCMSK